MASENMASKAGPRSYEELRMEKLRRNQQVMMNLGLNDMASASVSHAPKTQHTKNSAIARRKRLKESLESTPQPRRRSPRLTSDSEKTSTSTSTSTTTRDQVLSDDESEEEVQYSFDTSKAMLYSFDEDSSSSNETKKGEGNVLRSIGGGAADSTLKRMYALSFHSFKPLLAGGGHQGRVSVFSAACQKTKEEEVLLSFKASKGWISGVRFLSGMECGLVVTSNDGELSLWDCTVAHDMMPKKLFSQALHGKSGIFDVDLYESDFVTSSKDGSLCLGRIGEAKVDVKSRFLDAHNGVVKSVMFRPGEGGNIMCSGGNDSMVRIWDVRRKTDKCEVEFKSAFHGVINLTKWNPMETHLVLAASFASSMEMFDVRKASEPAVVFTGHFPPTCTRASGIYQPVFAYGGKRVVASGGGSKNLTMFSTSSGEVVSSGTVGWEAGALETSMDDRKIAVSHGSEVSFYECI